MIKGWSWIVSNFTPSSAFGIVQPITGTSPTATTPSDTLTLASADGTIGISGNSGTNTLDFSAREASASVSGIISLSSQTFGGGTKTFAANINLLAGGNRSINLNTPGSPGAGDALTINGAAGNDTGAGGGLNFTTGPGGAKSAVGTAANGGDFTATASAGGAAIISGSGTNTGGVGGNFTLTGGVGGTASGGTSNVPAAGGAFSITSGGGGIATTTSTNAGAAGALTLSGGVGGSVSTGTGTGGTGGNVNLNAGAGGASQSGGTAGTAGILTMNGGAAGGGSSSSKNGGAIYLIGGAKNSSGSDGNVFINANSSGTTRGFTSVGANTTPVSQFHIFSNSSSPITFIAQAQSGQSNDISQYRDAALNILGSVSSAGLAKVRQGTTSGSVLLVPVGASLKTNTTAVSSASTTETDLITYSVVGNTLGTNGDRVVFRMAGQFSASANTKQVKVKFGATTLLDTTALAITGATDWVIDGEIVRTGSATQVAIITFSSSNATTMSFTQYSTPTETLSTASTLKATGTVGGTGGADLTQKFLTVDWRPNN